MASAHPFARPRQQTDEPAVMRQEQAVEIVVLQDRGQQRHRLAIPGHDNRRLLRDVDIGAQPVLDLCEWRDLHGSNFS
jgi:hypothetical protein